MFFHHVSIPKRKFVNQVWPIWSYDWGLYDQAVARWEVTVIPKSLKKNWNE